MIETWRNIAGYNGAYQVSTYGRIRSMKTGKPVLMKLQNNEYGISVGLRMQEDISSRLQIKIVAKLVAETFISNPENFKYVDFKDGNRENCRADNLFWCEKTKQMKKRADVISKKVHQYTLEGKYLKTWSSITEIKKELGITGVSAACRGVQPAAGGYIWSFDDGTNPEEQHPVLTRSYSKSNYGRPIRQETSDGKLIRIWNSIKTACEEQNFSCPENISSCLRGRRKSAYGYCWCFDDEQKASAV